MAKIPRNFLEGGDAVVNMSFTEFSSGKGIVEFFLGTISGANILPNRLSNNEFYSDKVFNLGTTSTSQTYIKAIDLDYDADFLRPMIIEGQAIFNLPLGLGNDEAGTFIFYPHVRVRKWDGTNETEIADMSGAVIVLAPGAINQKVFHSRSIALDIPRTKIRKNESLRLTIEVWAKNTDGTSDYQVAFLSDPQNRLVRLPTGYETWVVGSGGNCDFSSTTGAFSKASVQIPFKIDL